MNFCDFLDFSLKLFGKSTLSIYSLSKEYLKTSWCLMVLMVFLNNTSRCNFIMPVSFNFTPYIWFHMFLFSLFWSNKRSQVNFWVKKLRNPVSSNCFSWNQLIIWEKKSITTRIFINFHTIAFDYFLYSWDSIMQYVHYIFMYVRV